MRLTTIAPRSPLPQMYPTPVQGDFKARFMGRPPPAIIPRRHILNHEQAKPIVPVRHFLLVVLAGLDEWLAAGPDAAWLAFVATYLARRPW